MNERRERTVIGRTYVVNLLLTFIFLLTGAASLLFGLGILIFFTLTPDPDADKVFIIGCLGTFFVVFGVLSCFLGTIIPKVPVKTKGFERVQY